MSEISLSPKRPRLDFDENSKEEQYDKYKSRDREREHDDSHSHSKHRKRAEPTNTVDEDDGKEEEGKTKLGNIETARREHTLVMRLTNKEQELQDCMNQIQEMKQAQTQNTAQLRSMLLDPAINLVFQRMAKEMDEDKVKLKEKQNELAAWKFTPDSQTGMRLISKCRLLLEENNEFGKRISSGRTSRLEGVIVLHKALATEMKKNQKELDEFVLELDQDVDGMQGLILMLKQQLKEAQEQIARLQAENEQLRTLSVVPDPEPGGSGRNTPSQPNEWPQAAGSPSRTTQLLSVAQPFEDFNSAGAFASKVTPDSGVHTQEEDEETTMDTTELPSAPCNVLQQSPSNCDQTRSPQPVADSTEDSSSVSAPDQPGAQTEAESEKPERTTHSNLEISQTERTTQIASAYTKADEIERTTQLATIESNHIERTTQSVTTTDETQRTKLSEMSEAMMDTAECEQAVSSPQAISSVHVDSSNSISKDSSAQQQHPHVASSDSEYKQNELPEPQSNTPGSIEADSLCELERAKQTPRCVEKLEESTMLENDEAAHISPSLLNGSAKTT